MYVATWQGGRWTVNGVVMCAVLLVVYILFVHRYIYLASSNNSLFRGLVVTCFALCGSVPCYLRLFSDDSLPHLLQATLWLPRPAHVLGETVSRVLCSGDTGTCCCGDQRGGA
jgi:hypothetical protein